MCPNYSKIIFILLLAFLARTTTAKDQQLILGVPSEDSAGIISISECDTGKIYKVGVMASNPYFHLASKIEELSKSGSVLVKIQGKIIVDGDLEIEQPEVISVIQGECGEFGT